MKKITFILAFAMAAASSFAAINSSADIIFPVIEMGTGARAMGMGGAFTAVADDVSAICWNTAGLGKIKNIQIGLTYDKWFMDTMFSRVMFAYPVSMGTLGADIVYMNLGEFPVRNDLGAELRSDSPFILGGVLGYGITFDDISAGAALKIINQSIAGISNAAFAADAGAMYRAGIVSVALSLQNIGYGDGYSLPINIRAGFAVKPVHTAMHGLLIALDAKYLFKDTLSASAGAEYLYNGTLAVRIGYKADFSRTGLEGLKGLSGGVGAKFGNFSFDYALSTYGDLGITHMATLTYGFADQTEQKPGEDIEEKSMVKNKKRR